MTSTTSFSERIEFLRQALSSADNIIIGAGSGLTTAAGLDYAGDDFRNVFAPWIERYGFTDLYTSSFYPFESREEYWAYWAEHIWFCRYRSGALPLYRVLKETLSAINPHRPTFIVTTNVDAQFELAGFPTDNIFATQGDYCFFQPASGSPKILINNKEWIMKVLPHIKDCRIPTELIPHMPDGSEAALNLRVDETFVEDYRWHRQAKRYTDFVKQASQGRLLLLEFGIGYNTPGIIRFPFEQMAQKYPHTTLVRFNRDYPEPYLQDLPRFTSFVEDIPSILSRL